MGAARRNSYTPSAGPSPLPNSNSEFRHRVVVTHAGGETRYPTLPFDATPGDSRLGQRVERVTLERCDDIGERRQRDETCPGNANDVPFELLAHIDQLQ